MENKIDSIGWHENNLKNQTNYIQSVEKEVKRKIDELEELKNNFAFYKLQIETAKKKKKKKFCSERFLKKKK